MLTDFQIFSLTDSLVNMQRKTIPPHLKRVAALPSETSISEN